MRRNIYEEHRKEDMSHCNEFEHIHTLYAPRNDKNPDQKVLCDYNWYDEERSIDFLVYNIPGFSKDSISLEKIWNNKDKVYHVYLYGSRTNPLEKEETVNIRLNMNPTTHDKILCRVIDGVLTVELHEKIEKAPEVEVVKE